ncbi:uncharacterized protein LOC107613265 [Arachis ipaensis]|uniref:uncharacterized protein LOC107613265 n=1 Tax=Arachis ipaensis TaxID=130454 RepID=UPI0007AF152A|nr:uncharacterized protein LOC107613265 [Arachis ipaensis]
MDKNTRYFHNIASVRRRNNKIDTLMIHGRLVRNQARIKGAIRGFYKDLYKQDYAPRIGIRDGLMKQIHRDEAETLEVMPSEEEIKEAVWDCESSKAPGSDGYNMNFIKRCWEDIGLEFIAAVLGFFHGTKLPPDEDGLRPTMEEVGEGVCYYGHHISPGKRVTIQAIQDGEGTKTRRPTFSTTIRASGRCLHMMVGKAVRNGRIAPLLVGSAHVELSHLQFADDTILFCPPVTETILNYKRLLRCFELISGLSINFGKSNLISVNWDQGWIDHAFGLLGCQQAALPVRYLGISLGANPRLVKTWKPIIDKVEQKHSLWKAKVLNKSGKLVLIKSVLNSLPIYYLSLYKMPKAVADKLIALQRNFMWCKENGNSGIALEDNWVQGGALKLSFSRLYSISSQQGVIIGDCGFWDGLEWIWNFQWRRELFQWELELVHQLHERLRSVKLSADREDNMVWKFENKGVFSTSSMIQAIQSKTLPAELTSYSFTSSLWKGFVPLRIELFGWFVLVGRVNTKERLTKLGVNILSDSMCVLCTKEIESTEHLFLRCEVTWQVWCKWLRALRQEWVIPGTIKELFESWRGMHDKQQE